MTDQTTEEAPEQQPLPAFTPDDLVAAIGLIDEAINQGAYKGWELIQRTIQIRTRIMMFAQHWQNTIDAASADAPTTTQTEVK